MNSIAFSVSHSLDGDCDDGRFVPTVLAAFCLTTLLTSAAFFLLGHFKLGDIVFFFPKHVILGCVGGIGVFVAKTGIDVSTGGTFDLNSITSITDFCKNTNPALFLVPIILVMVLRFLIWSTSSRMSQNASSLLPPTFFLSLTPLFYLAIMVLNLDFDKQVQRCPARCGTRAQRGLSLISAFASLQRC